MLERDVTRLSAPRACHAVLSALSRHARCPRLVGLAALSLVNIAHRDKAAAGAIADGGGCHLLVSALFGLAGDDGDVSLTPPLFRRVPSNPPVDSALFVKPRVDSVLFISR